MLKKLGFIASILFGLINVAHAGDPIDLESQIIAEPENNKNRSLDCEKAGPGFKYIPGTQTCIRISGHVQYEINIKSK